MRSWRHNYRRASSSRPRYGPHTVATRVRDTDPRESQHTATGIHAPRSNARSQATPCCCCVARAATRLRKVLSVLCLIFFLSQSRNQSQGPRQVYRIVTCSSRSALACLLVTAFARSDLGRSCSSGAHPVAHSTPPWAQQRPRRRRRRPEALRRAHATTQRQAPRPRPTVSSSSRPARRLRPMALLLPVRRARAVINRRRSGGRSGTLRK